jgi:hypothetical protein
VWIEAEAESGKEGLGLIQVPDRQVEDDLLVHDVSTLEGELVS